MITTSTTTYAEAVEAIREPGLAGDEKLARAVAFFAVRAAARFLAQGMSRSDYELLVDQATENAFFAIRDGAPVEHPAAFVWRVVINQAYATSRRGARVVECEWDDYAVEKVEKMPAMGLEDCVLAQRMAEEALMAVGNLPRVQRAAVYLVAYKGWRVSEVARYLGCAESTVRSAYKAGLAKLRRSLQATTTGEAIGLAF